MWKREDIIWAAGILEGEGAFTQTYNGGRSRSITKVQCHMTDLDILQRLQKVFNRGRINGPYSNKSGKKPFYTWIVSKSHEALAIMFAVFEFLGERRRTKIVDIVRGYQAPKFIS